MRFLFCLILLIWPVAALAEYNDANNWASSATYDECPVEPLDWFTKAEAWAWEQICLDRNAYMAAVPKDDHRSNCYIDPANASPYGSKISARFLQVVATQNKFTSTIPAQQISIFCADVDDYVNFINSNVPTSLYFYGVNFGGSVSFEGANTTGELVFSTSHFARHMELSELRAQNGVSLYASHFEQDVSLGYSQASWINLSKTVIQGKLKAEAVQIFSNANLENSVFNQGVMFVRAKVGGGLSFEASQLNAGADISFSESDWVGFTGATVRGSLLAEGARVRNNLLLENATFLGRGSSETRNVQETSTDTTYGNVVVVTEIQSFLSQDLDVVSENPKTIHLQDAKIGGNLTLKGSRVYGRINVLRAEVDAGLYAQDALLGELDVSQATIAHDLILTNSVIFKVDGDATSVGGNIYLRNSLASSVDFLDARIQGSVYANGAAIDGFELHRAYIGTSVHLRNGRSPYRPGLFEYVNLSNARIDGELHLQGSMFDYKVDLSGIEIGEALRLAQGDFVPIWGPESKLNLDNAKTDRLIALMPYSWLRVGTSNIERMNTLSEAFEYYRGECSYYNAYFDGSIEYPTEERLSDLVRCEMPDEFMPHASKPYNVKPPIGGYLSAGAGREYFVPLSILHFDYQSIDNGYDRPDENLNTRRELVEWVQASQRDVVFETEDATKAHITQYQASPFKHLVEYYRNNGNVHDANLVELQMHWDRLISHENTLLGWVYTAADIAWMILSAWGVYPVVAVFWFLLLVLVGTMVANEDRRPPPQRPEVSDGAAEQKVSAMLPLIERVCTVLAWPLRLLGFSWRWFWHLPILNKFSERVSWPCFWYSLETAVPLINPSEDHKYWSHNEKQQAYFHFQKIAGFVLASVVVASLTLG